ncbi:hypothetical protein EJ04DRAFT_159315 [Polyplosphaeria fusca]|uniref:J domain-containing protein n=1 Tax=Polyplosphaeria fusca TaxID=682080 RepID=A0A9P4QYV0_9PLEO|nr:hypothetical protein EJ04DRAFT_159315 [Polyplosphaeria fusca]
MSHTNYKNHYELLGIPLNASTPDIERAYQRILWGYNSRAATSMPPFKRMQAARLLQTTTIARDTLSDPATRVAYDRGLQADGTHEAANQSSDSGEAEYRYLPTDTGTKIQIRTSNWEMSLDISPKYVFAGEDVMVELSTHGPRTENRVAFTMTLQRDYTHLENEQELLHGVMIMVQRVARAAGMPQKVARATTVYKELSSGIKTLEVDLEAETCDVQEAPDAISPWTLGFDFDRNEVVPMPPPPPPSGLGRPVRKPYDRGTCLIFSTKETGNPFEARDILKKDKDMRAAVFADHQHRKYGGGGADMWLVGAVGWRE